MRHVPLMTVVDTFQLERLGLTLIPDFPLPDGWQSCAEDVTIETPAGQSFGAAANFNGTHFKLTDPNAPAERRLRVVISLPGMSKDRVPIGSRILVRPELRAALIHGA